MPDKVLYVNVYVRVELQVKHAFDGKKFKTIWTWMKRIEWIKKKMRTEYAS